MNRAELKAKVEQIVLHNECMRKSYPDESCGIGCKHAERVNAILAAVDVCLIDLFCEAVKKGSIVLSAREEQADEN